MASVRRLASSKYDVVKVRVYLDDDDDDDDDGDDDDDDGVDADVNDDADGGNDGEGSNGCSGRGDDGDDGDGGDGGNESHRRRRRRPFYVLSRFLIARTIAACGVDEATSTTAALALKKQLVNDACCDVSQRDMEKRLFALYVA
jgi:hypothetical protein